MTSSEQTNSYSQNWFEFFHANIDDARTTQELDFIYQLAPQPEFQKILDVCCGMGRHSRALSERGYAVTGIDRDNNAIGKARQLGGGASYIVADLRDYQPRRGWFDAAIVMGQSFGHFDARTNLDVIHRLAVGIRNGGRIILDLWNREFFEAHQGERDLKTSRGLVRENKRVEYDRVFVELNYPDGIQEKFEWQLFTPPQMQQFAKPAELRLLSACSGFDTSNGPSPSDPRIQLVLERAT